MKGLARTGDEQVQEQTHKRGKEEGRTDLGTHNFGRCARTQDGKQERRNRQYQLTYLENSDIRNSSSGREVKDQMGSLSQFCVVEPFIEYIFHKTFEVSHRKHRTHTHSHWHTQWLLCDGPALDA